MLFDTRLYVSRGVPKLREVAMEIVRPSSGFRLSQYDASGENLYVCDFIDERKQKIIKNVPELLKGISILDLKAKGEREYSINASLVWGNLVSGSDSDENIGLSEITGLPIIPQRFVSEYEEMYKKIRSEDLRGSRTIFEGMERQDRMLGQSINHLSIMSANEASFVDTSNPDEVVKFMLKMADKGHKDMYEILAIQNMLNARKGNYLF